MIDFTNDPFTLAITIDNIVRSTKAIIIANNSKLKRENNLGLDNLSNL